jgi:electron transfer flavoprotein alpha subunit
MPHVLFLAETRDAVLRKVAFEVATAARGLADKLGCESHAIVAAAANTAEIASSLGEFGADVVLTCEHAGFAEHNPEALSALVSAACKERDYAVVLFAASVHGRDTAPRVAARLGVGLAADVVSLTVVDGSVQATHPVNTGKLIISVRLSGAPAVLSLRPNMFTAEKNARSPQVEAVQPVGNPSAPRTTISRTGATGGPATDLSEAAIIVSGGRGLKAPENFALVEELAAAFGKAAVGCTRAVSDAGWRPHSDQIGQTGRTVSPDLYIAVAISGAIQHIAGMRNSRTIVAINKDREAPIFKVADYGIVGDAFEIVPRLTQAVKEINKGG